MGVELPEPLINEATRAANFTNERAVGGMIRFLTIGAGMWLVQQVRRSLAQRGENYTYAQLAEHARARNRSARCFTRFTGRSARPAACSKRWPIS